MEPSVYDRGGRSVLITGASSGIGQATAHRLASRGDHLTLFARSGGPLDAVAAQCLLAGAGSVQVVAADVTDAAAVDRAVQAVRERHGTIDVVIQSAGLVAYGDFVDVPVDIFNGVVETNVLGAANVARSALTAMRSQKAGTLVLIGSVLGNIAVPRMSAYVVSKWAVRSLARELQLEHRNYRDIHISCVSPGSVDTPIYLQAANYAGRIGRPPPPVLSPERVARRVVETVDRPRTRVNVGPANFVMKFGFSATPRLFDAVVGPFFSVAALDRRRVDPHPGNVPAPQPDLNRLHGGQGSSVVATIAAIGSKITGVVAGLVGSATR